MSANSIEIRFYEELNDFLAPERRKVAFRHQLKQWGSVKDLVESLGVPHTEVDLILVNGTSVDFDYLVRDGDRISVYPVFEALDITPVTHLRPTPLRDPRFVLDGHLGKLAAYLRLLGFDTLYRNDYDDPTLARISADEHRILLTRDRRLLMRKQISHGYFVREIHPRKQLREVLERLDLFRAQRPFTRCMHCNGEIRPVEKSAVEAMLPPLTKAWCMDFRQCARCGKVYWRGAHFDRLEKIVRSVNGDEEITSTD
ncbi:MAG: twitching motility protein PilT [Gammaproteobacteria bacterium]|nr:twitching motility protein PilT [Gammaproteobacteria bacterium]